MFLVKKWLGAILSPLPLGLGIAVCGLILLWFTRRHRLGRILATLGVAGLFLFSLGPVADSLLGNLAGKYRPYNTNDLPVGFAVKYIVVLGGGHVADPRLPATSQLSLRSLSRLVEGVRIYREQPGRKLVLSGGGVAGSDGETMAWAATDLGVDQGDLLLETESLDTKDQARAIRAMVGGEPFILVTSASHMVRALALFRKQGMAPYPAPVENLIKERRTLTPYYLLPSAGSLGKSAGFFYEILGMLWARLRGLL